MGLWSGLLARRNRKVTRDGWMDGLWDGWTLGIDGKG
jgi:hypothetical protein